MPTKAPGTKTDLPKALGEDKAGKSQVNDLMAAEDMFIGPPPKPPYNPIGNLGLVRTLMDKVVYGHNVDGEIANLSPEDKALFQREASDWAERYDQSGSAKEFPRPGFGVPANTGIPLMSEVLDRHFGTNRTRPGSAK